MERIDESWTDEPQEQEPTATEINQSEELFEHHNNSKNTPDSPGSDGAISRPLLHNSVLKAVEYITKVSGYNKHTQHTFYLYTHMWYSLVYIHRKRSTMYTYIQGTESTEVKMETRRFWSWTSIRWRWGSGRSLEIAGGSN